MNMCKTHFKAVLSRFHSKVIEFINSEIKTAQIENLTKITMTKEQIYNEVERQINAAITELRKEGIIVVFPPTNIKIEKL